MRPGVFYAAGDGRQSGIQAADCGRAGLASGTGCISRRAAHGVKRAEFYGLAMTDFSTQQWQARGLMALGFSAASALLALTSQYGRCAGRKKQRRPAR